MMTVFDRVCPLIVQNWASEFPDFSDRFGKNETVLAKGALTYDEIVMSGANHPDNSPKNDAACNLSTAQNNAHAGLAVLPAEMSQIRLNKPRKMRRTPVARASIALQAPSMTLVEAIGRLPADKTKFDKARFRWIDLVRGLFFLTSAQRQVGLAIARYINHNPNSPWYHSAWAGHRKIAEEIGQTRRTVVTAFAALSRIGLIAVEHGGGWKVPGGRTDRYTLRIDWLDVLERAAQVRKDDVKDFHRSNKSDISQRHRIHKKMPKAVKTTIK
jgi:hypothetical protein